MKFIYYSDQATPIGQVLTDQAGVEIISVNSVQEIAANLPATLLIVLEQPPSSEVLEWKKNNPEIKIILFSKSLSDAYLRDIQLSDSFYDLFFRYPVSFFEVEKNYKVISPFTNSAWNIADLNAKVELSVEDDASKPDAPVFEMPKTPGTETLHINSLLRGEDSSSRLDLDKAEVSSDAALNLTDSVPVLEESNQTGHVPIEGLLEDETVTNLNLNELTSEADSLQLSTDQEEVDKEAEALPELAGPTLTQPENHFEDKVEENIVVSAAQEAGVSLDEILQSKDDQIFRLLSQTSRLKDELAEKEELIKTLQRDVHEQSSSVEQSKRDAEEALFQLKVVKTTLEKDKSDLERALDSAREKVSLLEQRVVEIKKEYQKISQAGQSADIRKYKVRQEQLEDKISLLQSDTAMQLQNREKRIVELKRKIDLLEFDLRDSHEREKDYKQKIQHLEDKLQQMKQALRQVVDESISETLEVKKIGTYDL